MNANMAKVQTNGSGDQYPTSSKPPKATIEKTYQKKSQLEHILLRPDTYIGSVEQVTELMWVYDAEKECIVQREISYVPGLYKIFDEILVNAADNKQRDKEMNVIKVVIDPETNTISVWNNGKGIPVAMHKDENMFVPTMIFGHLLTSSNYSDEEEKVTGGRNGYGAKLCNIFSSKFTVETSSKDCKKVFKQTWTDNMSKASEAKIKPNSDDYTKITFCPDLQKFKMTKLDDDIVSLLSRRAFDVAASTKGVRVFLNGKKLPIKGFREYVDMYIKDKEDDTGMPLKVTHESVNERWEIAMTISDHGFKQVSFVNSIATTKGGRHVDHVTDYIVKHLIEILKKKNKGGTSIKPFQVKNHMWIFVNCLIVNPTFDSQTKENMTLQVKSFGSKCAPSDKFILAASKSGIVESVLSWAKFKAQKELVKASGKKQCKLKGIPKLEDANEAGSSKSIKCTLILTEGDSAKTLAVSGLSVIGRDFYGVFPLRGKLLNVREATHKQILENAEINNLIKILGLQYKKKYLNADDLKSLRYGKVMIMTDQDQDGSHIKGLLLNFIHNNWPELLRLDFLEEFITPIVKCTKKKDVLSFYSLPEFEEWKINTPNAKTYNVKYYKGLGTSTSTEAKEYFQNMARHRIKFVYKGQQDDQNIIMAFSKKCIEQRKEWLSNYMTETRRRKELGLAEKYLYMKNTKEISYTDFINLELVLFSNMDNTRSIPCLVDGFKPGQRKILFTCFKRNDKREVKVAQLAGSVAEHSAYHHGEVSLCGTIVNLAQNYVGSNNINLLEPRGQFGTRLVGGKDSASPRYIFTIMSPLTRLIFHPHDDALLKHEYDDNLKIEPVWYVPIIPMVLINGADGIGTGWMTKIPNFDPRRIVENIRLMLDGEEMKELLPFYKNFKGTIEKCADQKYAISGEIAIIGQNKVEITELPIGMWTQSYKENVLEPMLHGSEKTKAVIADYKEYNTDTTVKFVITCCPGELENMQKEGLHFTFKLQTVYSTTSMVLFDEFGALKKYNTPEEIIKQFYGIRLKYYQKRKDYLEGSLKAEADKLTNQARFIVEKCNQTLVVENKKRKVIIDELKKKGYDPDPIKQWIKRVKDEEDDDARAPSDTEEEEEETTSNSKQPQDEEQKFNRLQDVQKYGYLLGMSMWMLTEEKKNELLKQRDQKQLELNILKGKTSSMLWIEDLDKFITNLDEIEEKERNEEAGFVKKLGKNAPKVPKGKKVPSLQETMPSPLSKRVEPVIHNELKKKVLAATRAKENKIKREKVVIDDDGEKDEFDDMVKSKKTLKDKLGTPEELEKKTGVRAKKKKVEKGGTGDGMKQTTLEFKKLGPKKPKEKGSPRKGKKSFSSSDESDASLPGSDSNSSEVETAAARQRSKRNVKAIKYDVFAMGDDDDADDDDDGDTDRQLSDNKLDNKTFAISSDSETEEKPPQRMETSEDMFDSLIAGRDISPQTEKEPPVVVHDLENDEFFSDDDMQPLTKKLELDEMVKKVAPTKKEPKEKVVKEKKNGPPKKRKKIYESDEQSMSDDDIFADGKKSKKADSDEEFSLPVAQSRGGGRAKKPMKYNFDDSDSD